MNVFDFALKMEEDGKKFYQKLAAESRRRRIKSIFSILADAEESIRQVFEAMKKSAAPANADSKVLEKSRNVFEDLLERKNVLDMLKGDPDGYRHAIRCHDWDQAVRGYVKEGEQPRDCKNFPHALPREKRKHLEIMENIYDFVEAPKTFLPGESSAISRGLSSGLP